MRNIIVCAIHSTIDVMTNSSSELFVCKTKKSVDHVIEILRSILLVYNEGKHSDYAFDEVFGKIWIADRSIKDFEEYYEFVINKGDLVIESTGDNSVPYGFFELIEDMFDGFRHHLG